MDETLYNSKLDVANPIGEYLPHVQPLCRDDTVCRDPRKHWTRPGCSPAGCLSALLDVTDPVNTVSFGNKYG